MNRYKTVKNDRIKFAAVLFQHGLGTYSPGKSRGMPQTFIEYKTHILRICIAVCNKIRPSDKIQKEIFYKKRQQKSGFCYRLGQIGRELSPDYVFAVFLYHLKARGLKDSIQYCPR